MESTLFASFENARVWVHVVRKKSQNRSAAMKTSLDQQKINPMQSLNSDHEHAIELPLEIWEEILSYLPYEDLLYLSSVCQNQ